MARFNFKARENAHELDEVVLVPPRPIRDYPARVPVPHTPEWAPVFTANGARGYEREPRQELYLLAVSNMVGADTYYEAAAERDARFRELAAAVAVDDPEWFARFVPWLRTGALLRSASVVAALEGARAQLAAGITGSRALVDAALQRADEPGEALAYWLARYGRPIPKPVKRGIADAARRLYTEKSLLKYDTDRQPVRFGDVVDLTRPKPVAPWQADLFRHALDRRHQRTGPVPASLPTVAARAELMAVPVEGRAAITDPAVLAGAGMTWEALAGWRQSTMDAAAWEAAIPSMGYFALLRNLRNFDRAGVGDDATAAVAARLADPAEVARSRVLPMRFLSAYEAAGARWAEALESALQAALSHVPPLDGRLLVLVDTSGSMAAAFSRDGTLAYWQAAALFGLGLAARATEATVVTYSDHHALFPLVADEPVLASLRRFREGYFIGCGTRTERAVRERYAGHDRVVILTDEQADPHRGRDVAHAVPRRVPVYTWNLAGYRIGHTPQVPNRCTFGGLTDAAFGMIPLVEAGADERWPF
ncbi:RNA-binding protein [Catellatospora sp. TT07R-123]|uniref:TROVE domain-containing protein n=1 Tax=Catellatospora sp. TT07R-123 TaxID=2733863 RepID=UPI001B1D0576|nr:TROVE domain-containing protein [Catellatospora sp. TT07R-123]GHJ49253.1 RNA-binding protein [Catellatospora sp. TT07R-123]